MKGFFRYLRARLLLCLKYYPRVLALIALTAVLLGCLAGGFFRGEDEKNEAQILKVKIGVVGNLEDTYIDLAVFALQNIDSSKYYAEMVTLEEDEAEKMLSSGEIIGYVIVPDGYVETVLSGDNQALSYVVNKSPATFVPILMNEVIESVSHYVIESENGIYGFMNYCRDNGISRSEYRSDADILSIEYLQTILAREKYVQTEYISDSAALDFKSYYICAFFVIALLLWGITLAPMLIKKDMSLPRLLSFSDTGAAAQVTAEFFSFLLPGVINTFILFFAADILGGSALELLVLDAIGADSALWLFFRVLPVVFLVAALQFFLYELSRSVISGVLLQLFSTVVLSFVSGFFFPSQSLPESIQRLGAALPTGVCFEYLSGMFAKSNGDKALSAVILWGLGLILISVAVRKKRIGGDE